MATFTHEQIHFNYQLHGEGPAVVFCHGLTGDLNQGAQFIGAFPNHQLLLWDFRAHGETAPVGPPTKLSMASFAEDLEALLSHLGINKVVLGGNSLGAAVAVRFAIERPGRVKGLFLVRPAWMNHPLPEGLQLYPQAADFLERHGCGQGEIEFRKLNEVRDFLDREPEAARGLLEQFHKPLAFERLERIRRIPNDCPIRDWKEIQGLETPSLVIGNESDFVHPLSYAQSWAKRLPLGRLAQAPPKATNPAAHAESLRDHFRRFLQSLPG